MSLGRQTFQGLIWVSLTTGFIKLLNFITSIILARLLTPKDFGLISIGLIIVNFFEICRDLGVGTALIQKEKDPEYKAANTAIFILPAIAFLLYIIIYVSSPIIATFFHEARLESIVRILSIFILIASFGVVPQVLITKKLEFKKKIFPELLSKMGYSVSTIVFALNGYGVWSLVIGWLVFIILNGASYWYIVKWRPNFEFDKKIAYELIGYGKHIMWGNIIILFISAVDIIFIGRILGTDQLGLYSVAMSIAGIFSIQIAQIIRTVIFPVYVKLKADSITLKSAYMKTLKYVCFFTIPTTFVIIILAYDFIKVVYGMKWLASAMALQILCIFGLCRAILTISENLFMASGKPEIRTRINLQQLILMSILMYPLTFYYGILGSSIAVTVPAVILIGVTLREASKIIEKNPFEIAGTLFTITISAAVMSIILLIFKNVVSFSPSIIHILTFISISIFFYLGCLWIFDRLLLCEIRDILNKSLSEK